MVGRRAVLTLSLLALAAASSGVAAVREPAQTPSCLAALVHYEQNRGLGGGTTAQLPWIATGPAATRLVGYLWSYTAGLADGRVNRSPRLVLHAGVRHKVLWHPRKGGGIRLQIVARRLDGPGSFTGRFGPASVPGSGAGIVFASALTFPASGCWELTLRTGALRRTVVVEVVGPAAPETCDATPVDESGSITLTPPRARLAAAWGWRTPDGGALLYVGGRTPDGGNTKVLWRTTSLLVSGELVLRGTQLDGAGSFSQTLREVNPRGYWPSIVVIPNPGCWLLAVRIGGHPRAAGILVARVVDG